MYILCKTLKKEGKKVANHAWMCYNQSKKWMGHLPQLRQEESHPDHDHNAGPKPARTLPPVQLERHPEYR